LPAKLFGDAAAAAKLFRDLRCVQSGRDGPAPDLRGELRRNLIKALHQIFVRDQLTAHEVADRRDDGAVLVTDPEIHGSPPLWLSRQA